MASQKQAVVMLGIAGSGKSTTASALYPSYTVVNPDIIGERLYGQEFINNPAMYHDTIKLLVNDELKQAIATGNNIVLDTTAKNINKAYKRIEALKQAGYRITLVYIKVSLLTALQRNASRLRHVPEQAIISAYDYIESSYDMLQQFVDKAITINND
jgi:predicted ABC-type ATPase